MSKKVILRAKNQSNISKCKELLSPALFQAVTKVLSFIIKIKDKNDWILEILR